MGIPQQHTKPEMVTASIRTLDRSKVRGVRDYLVQGEKTIRGAEVGEKDLIAGGSGGVSFMPDRGSYLDVAGAGLG